MGERGLSSLLLVDDHAVVLTAELVRAGAIPLASVVRAASATSAVASDEPVDDHRVFALASALLVPTFLSFAKIL